MRAEYQTSELIMTMAIPGGPRLGKGPPLGKGGMPCTVGGPHRDDGDAIKPGEGDPITPGGGEGITPQGGGEGIMPVGGINPGRQPGTCKTALIDHLMGDHSQYGTYHSCMDNVLRIWGGTLK